MSGEITPFPGSKVNGHGSKAGDLVSAQKLANVPKTEEEMVERLKTDPGMFAAYKYGQSHAFAKVKPALDEGLKQAAGLKAALLKIADQERTIEKLRMQISNGT